MGWKSALIVVTGVQDVNYSVILENLGLSAFEEAGEETFEVAINPDDDLYIGNYQDNLLISNYQLVNNCLQSSISQVEQGLLSMFPKSEIAVMSLHSAINHWGYSVIKDGQKIRARAGDADNGTVLDFGEPLEEEIELLSKSKVGTNGQRIYVLEEIPEESFFEDQVGEDFVFVISSRYFEDRLDTMDDLLFETKLKKFVKKSWWKFW